jgi:hypothetical protein
MKKNHHSDEVFVGIVHEARVPGVTVSVQHATKGA